MGHMMTNSRGACTMKSEISSIMELIPDAFEILRRRYRILQYIDFLAPVGRRVLAQQLDMSERSMRTETDLLKQQHLVVSSRGGMSLTAEGLQLYHELEPIMKSLSGESQREVLLAEYLGIDRAVIIPGDSDDEHGVFTHFGHYLTDLLQAKLAMNHDNVIVVLGGTTLKKVADHMRKVPFCEDHNVFVSGRGGIGEKVEVQANTISARMAERVGGDHVSLYVPESVSQSTYDTLLLEPAIQKALQLISQATCVIHGIGSALHMAENRGMTEDQIQQLIESGAVAETFGYFYNSNGEVVYRLPRIGLQLEDMGKVPNIFAVAGGKNKAKVIQAYMKNAPHQTCLLTDEGAANEILKGLSL